MSDIFKEEARRLCKTGAISPDELNNVLSAYNLNEKSIVKSIAMGISVQSVMKSLKSTHFNTMSPVSSFIVTPDFE